MTTTMTQAISNFFQSPYNDYLNEDNFNEKDIYYFSIYGMFT